MITIDNDELAGVTGGNADDCYHFSLKRFGIDVGINIGHCEMTGEA